MKYFTTRRILNRNFYNATVFYLNKKTVSDFAENFAFMKLRLVLFSIVKMANLTVFVFFKRLDFEFIYFFVSDTDIKHLQSLGFWIEKYTTCQVLEELSYNVSIFELKSLQRVQLGNTVFPACQISNWNFYNRSDFERNFWQSFSFWLS